MTIKKLFYAFLSFISLALVVELAILITTKVIGWDPNVSGRPWVVSAHVHIIVLGALVTLMLIILDKVYSITKLKLFKPFYITYLVGFTLLISFILYKGFSQLLGASTISGLLQGGAAIAHITMFTALFMFIVVLKQALFGVAKSNKPTMPQDNEDK